VPANLAPTSNAFYAMALPATLADIGAANRRALETAPKWMADDAVYNNALFHYGLPPHVRHLIDLPVGAAPTIPDVLGLLLTHLNTQPRYLEIGVSVGKCLFQIQWLLGPGAVVTAFDVENINPAYAGTLGDRRIVSQYTGAQGSGMRNGLSCGVDSYTGPNGQPFFYVTSDEFDRRGWTELQSLKRTYNGVYSDALHTQEALLYEWGQLRDLGLIPISSASERWFMAWDDLDPSLMQGFQRIVADARTRVGPGITVHARTYKVNGWLGEHEYAHPFGVMANFPLDFLDGVGLVPAA
jgi:hypothetical protein